ncbi:MAG TPA: carboxyl transferase domain-containing protein, partial [Dehalococcoidales bacterium]
MTEDTEIKTRQLKELAERREKIREMGGQERVEAQKKKGKLTARERIDQLMDKGSFREIGVFARSRGAAGEVPADAVVTGYGQIDGRKV